jgi:hypothetical protein
MMHRLMNLLPRERERSLRQVYFLRFATASVLMAAGLVVVHGAFLLPSYLYLKDLARERKGALAALAGSEEQEVSSRVKSLAEDSAYLARLASVPKASASVSAIIALPRPGIVLTGFSFAPSKDGADMRVSGSASTREALRAYEQALKSAPFIAGVELPISAYAKERDIEFTIALSGPLLP